MTEKGDDFSTSSKRHHTDLDYLGMTIIEEINKKSFTQISKTLKKIKVSQKVSQNYQFYCGKDHSMI